jgi:UDP-2-acetamido-2,6-beta-L-arabino-hexul-4-ose reductase
MRLLITGANGFIAQNLISHLSLEDDLEISTFTRSDSLDILEAKVQNADMVCHLAGVNRPKNEDEFKKVNFELTKFLCEAAKKAQKSIPIIFTSSTQATLDNEYGKSKLHAEELLNVYSKETGSATYIFRLTNVMGKWCQPNYNSVVATFCHNIANDIPIKINDPEKELSLIYIDDLIIEITNIIRGENNETEIYEVKPVYKVTLKELAEKLYSFKESRVSLTVDEVGSGITRALYATYLSYLKEEEFSYKIPEYNDERGRFAELLKTKSSGQFSYFTSKPGVTRGKHYHHTKSEKFMVVSGEAEFKFRHILTGKEHKVNVDSQNPLIVETIPGWAHQITNTGDNELVVFLWANEIFDRNNPDTYGIN